MILIEKIIQKYENSAQDWKGGNAGNRSIRIQQKDYDEVGKSQLLWEAVELEEQGLIRVKWFNNKTDIEKIIYSLEDINKMHQLIGKTPKIEILRQMNEFVAEQMEVVKERWIMACYEEMLRQLDNGSIPKNLMNYEAVHEDESELNSSLFCTCLNALDVLREPIYKRIFSKHYLGNSKIFEKVFQLRIISQARKYHPDIDDNMNDSEVLSQLYIEEYSQELALKGELILELAGEQIDLSVFIYGTVLTSEMLKHAQIAVHQNIRKIITVENRANYMSMKYEPGTLIIYSHGYFSPKERDFLKELERVLCEREVDYLHTGDLDYGGIKIFQYIRKFIFPQLRPFLMDVGQFEAFRSMGEQMGDSAWEKMRVLKDPLMQPLIDKIVEEKIVIEQESFL
ncbi:Wadjet anti-phage system protein JetD domain-containing protein [Cohnella phaseoli]|nr:Wadjet anti-phage system protein JetD domain-containing protein [Cohnella phaseoli]